MKEIERRICDKLKEHQTRTPHKPTMLYLGRVEMTELMKAQIVPPGDIVNVGYHLLKGCSIGNNNLELCEVNEPNCLRVR